MSRYAPRFGSTVNRQRPGIVRWCGPGVLSVLSGLDYDEIERRINDLRGEPGDKRVKGMMLIEIKEMIEELGLVWVEMPQLTVDGQYTARYTNGATAKCKVKRVPTFIRWLRETREVRGDDVYMIFTGNHVMLAQGDMVVDNCTRGPVPYEKANHRRRARIICALCILKDEEIAA